MALPLLQDFRKKSIGHRRENYHGKSDRFYLEYSARGWTRSHPNTSSTPAPEC